VHDEPVVKSINDISNDRGTVLLPTTPQVEQLFPALTGSISLDQIAFLMASSRLVGMVVPGLHSLYSEILVEHSDNPNHQEPKLGYQVKHVDTRFRLITIDVNGAGLSGQLKAFTRPEPTDQASMESVVPLTKHSEFRGKRVLIIGGSRGLGESCAKILASGGADIVFSYSRGESDASRVATEIKSFGGSVKFLRFDAMDMDDNDQYEMLAQLKPTHLMYFATPPISSSNAKGTFQSSTFERFARVYVASFGRLANLLAKQSLAGIYYPSTIFLNEEPDDMMIMISMRCWHN
jgi:hypothetical protein